MGFLSFQEFIAKAITLPGIGEIMDMMTVADPDAVHAVRTFIRKQLASELKQELLITVMTSRTLKMLLLLLPILNLLDNVLNENNNETYFAG